jgi:hypothetical protein
VIAADLPRRARRSASAGSKSTATTSKSARKVAEPKLAERLDTKQVDAMLKRLERLEHLDDQLKLDKLDQQKLGKLKQQKLDKRNQQKLEKQQAERERVANLDEEHNAWASDHDEAADGEEAGDGRFNESRGGGPPWKWRRKSTSETPRRFRYEQLEHNRERPSMESTRRNRGTSDDSSRYFLEDEDREACERHRGYRRSPPAHESTRDSDRTIYERVRKRRWRWQQQQQQQQQQQEREEIQAEAEDAADEAYQAVTASAGRRQQRNLHSLRYPSLRRSPPPFSRHHEGDTRYGRGGASARSERW